MELYRIIATIANTSTTFQLAYLPENFEGIKINQNFSFVNPIGFNPKFSVDTMRIILSDKAAIDTVFNTYGLQSNVTFLIKKLNTSGIGYSNLATFAIDFESYEIQSEFSEFALKSVSAMDYYNQIKNSEINLELTSYYSLLPTTLNLINYVSLRMSRNFNTNLTYFGFSQNNEPKVYDGDYSLYREPYITGTEYTDLDTYIYGIGKSPSLSNTIINISGKIKLKFSGVNKTGLQVVLRKIDKNGFDSIKHTFFTKDVVIGGTSVSLDFNTTVNLGICSSEDVLVVTTNHSGSVPTIEGDFFIDIKKQTERKILESPDNRVYFRSTAEVFNQIFNFNYSTDELSYLDRGLTSANHLTGKNDIAIIKPSEFLSEISKILGLIVNFKLDGQAEVNRISYYFDNLLNISNAIPITEFNDLVIKHSSDLVFKSVKVGHPQKDYSIYPYFINWMKELTFSQNNRYGSEELDLSLAKYRTDFAGMLDFYMMQSKQEDKNYSDIFIFDYLLDKTLSTTPDNVYDVFTPRNILTNWSRFLSFAFQNFGLNTLTVRSNGGTTDNLNIQGVLQMDNLTLNETPRLLPIQYDFTCLLDSVDFSEKILKINDNGTDIYLFVIKAETTDNLSEQKISGLKIQF